MQATSRPCSTTTNVLVKLTGLTRTKPLSITLPHLHPLHDPQRQTLPFGYTGIDATRFAPLLGTPTAAHISEYHQLHGLDRRAMHTDNDSQKYYY